MTELLNSCWKALCLLSEAVKNSEESIEFCCIQFGECEKVAINETLPPSQHQIKIAIRSSHSPSNIPSFVVQDITCAALENAKTLDKEIQNLIELYAPYCFFSVYAKQQQRCFVVTHFAQSLDGYIATTNGDSKWIGNQENLIHAHRMRALCDGVLVGKNTLLNDNPQLTVRHVYGKNPARIILGSHTDHIDTLLANVEVPIFWIGYEPYPNKHVSSICFPKEQTEISPLKILQKLYEQKIYSIYLEGGSTTSSCFLREGLIDIVQLHISPLIFGSGINNFSLPQIDSVKSAVHFSSYQYIPVGDEVMFIGKL